MFLETNEEKKKELQEEYKVYIPDLSKKLEAILVKNGGKYFVGNSVREQLKNCLHGDEKTRTFFS